MNETKRTTRAVPQSSIERPSSSAITSISGAVVDDADVAVVVDDADADDGDDDATTLGCGSGLAVADDDDDDDNDDEVAMRSFGDSTGDSALGGDVAPSCCCWSVRGWRLCFVA
jgi:hypothetical protein